MSEELDEGVGGFFGAFFEDPVAGVFEDDGGDVGGDELHLLRQGISQGFVAADGENGHSELGLGELGEILGCLLEGDEVGPGGAHASWARVRRDIGLAIFFRKGAGLMGGEVVPEVFEVSAFAALD